MTASLNASSNKKVVDVENLPNPFYYHHDLNPEQTAIVLQSAQRAFILHEKSELRHWKDCATLIKQALDSSDGTTGWHVIVGSSFGSYVSHEVRHCVFFALGHMKVLAFKHG